MTNTAIMEDIQMSTSSVSYLEQARTEADVWNIIEVAPELLQSPYGPRAVVKAVCESNTAVLHALLAAGANPNARGTDGRCALLIAAEGAKAENYERYHDHLPPCAALLLQHGARRLESDESYDRRIIEEAMDKAAKSGNHGVLAALLSLGAPINFKNTQPLNNAAFHGHLESLRLLLAAGADPNESNSYLFTPLHAAAQCGRIDCVKALLERPGINASMRTYFEGQTPLHLAAKSGGWECVKALATAGVDVNETDDDGYTALHIAVIYDDIDVVKLLLELEAKLEERDCSGRTPLENAVVYDNLKMVELLLGSGASSKGLRHQAKSKEVACLLERTRNNTMDRFLQIFRRQKKMQDKKANDNSHNIATQFLETNKTFSETDVKSAKPVGVSIFSESKVLSGTLTNTETTPGLTQIMNKINLDSKLSRSNFHLDSSLLPLPSNLTSTTYVSTTLSSEHNSKETQTEFSYLDNDSNLSDFCSKSCQSIPTCVSSFCPTISPFLKSSMIGDVQSLEHLLATGSSINEKDYRGDTVLHHTSAGGHLEALKALLAARHVNIEVRGHDLNSPLHCAASRGRANVVRYLLSMGSNIDSTNIREETPLSLAARQGNLEIVDILVQEGANIDLYDINQSSPLHLACSSGHTIIVEHLILSGASVNKTDTDGRTPLFLAYYWFDIVKILLDNGSSTEIRSKEGDTVLLQAMKHTQWHVAKLLIEKGADSTVSSIEGITPLHMAAKCGRVDIVDMICEYTQDQLNLNAYTNSGDTPLTLALQQKQWSVASFLLHNGASPLKPGRYHKIPLLFAVDNSAPQEIVDQLLTLGAGSSVVDVQVVLPHVTDICTLNALLEACPAVIKTHVARTTLHAASRNGQQNAVMSLLNVGVDVESSTEQGWTALCYASSNGHHKIVEVLLNFGANPNATTNELVSPLHLAAIGGHAQTVRILLERGASVNMRTNSGKTPFHWASSDPVRELLKQKRAWRSFLHRK